MKPSIIPRLSGAALVLLIASMALPIQAATAFESKRVEELIEQTLATMHAHYLVPGVVEQVGQFVSAKRVAGHYDGITSLEQFAEVVGHDIRVFTDDDHLSLYVKQPNERSSHIKNAPEGRLSHNLSFEQLGYLPGNIGYLKFNKFHPSTEAPQVVDAAMAFLSRADGLIIDLRENLGGSPQLVQYLASHFVDNETELWRVYGRDRKLHELVSTTSIAGQQWPAEKPVVLLTAWQTGSAAELFAGVMQAERRATLIGETTTGAGYYVGVRDITDRLVFRISLFEPVISASGENWERVGVRPDIAVPTIDALDEGHHWLRQRLSLD